VIGQHEHLKIRRQSDGAEGVMAGEPTVHLSIWFTPNADHASARYRHDVQTPRTTAINLRTSHLGTRPAPAAFDIRSSTNPRWSPAALRLT
jgi:hypothetical protein